MDVLLMGRAFQLDVARLARTKFFNMMTCR